MTPEIYRENLPWEAVPSVLGGTLPDLSVWASTEVWFHQLRSGATSLQIEEANTQNKGIFSEEMPCIFLLCLWMWEVLRVGPKSHHTFSIWALKMHLVSCRCIIWSLILPFIRVGFVLFSHCFKVGSPPTLRDEAVEGSGLCCTLLLNTWWLLAQLWPYLKY